MKSYSRINWNTWQLFPSCLPMILHLRPWSLGPWNATSLQRTDYQNVVPRGLQSLSRAIVLFSWWIAHPQGRQVHRNLYLWTFEDQSCVLDQNLSQSPHKPGWGGKPTSFRSQTVTHPSTLLKCQQDCLDSRSSSQRQLLVYFTVWYLSRVWLKIASNSSARHWSLRLSFIIIFSFYYTLSISN